MRSDPPSTFIDLARHVARQAGRLLLNGLATRAGAVGGLPAPQRVRTAAPLPALGTPRRGR